MFSYGNLLQNVHQGWKMAAWMLNLYQIQLTDTYIIRIVVVPFTPFVSTLKRTVRILHVGEDCNVALAHLRKKFQSRNTSVEKYIL